ncbi:MAG TPA: 3'(2'),5'-bisphosphate nucleotidase CysQ [Steroidobacteraceae bacterium]
MSAASPQLLARVADIARRAGREILEIYASGEFAARTKADASPLTAADLSAHRLILDSLRELTPDIPVLSEEAVDTPFAQRSRWRRYWLVDPLDGTKEFLSRNGQFTVNIALIDGHAPALGVVHVPVTDTSYRGLPGFGAWRQKSTAPSQEIHVQARASSPLRVVGSRSHRGDSLDAFLARVGPHELVPVGSSLKFCMVAEGAADVYPRLGPTSEWDTAAAHAVVTGAGGRVSRLDGAALEYNTREELLNPFFVAYGPRDRDWLALLR